jgi:hypothetical protein
MIWNMVDIDAHHLGEIGVTYYIVAIAVIT